MIYINCNGTDLERSSQTSLFVPNNTFLNGGTGTLTDYSTIGGGSGNVTTTLNDFENRNGVNPSGGQGVL